MHWLSWGHRGRELSDNNNGAQVSRILNSNERAELRVGRVGVVVPLLFGGG
jgi:hypothetical protein